MHRVKSNSSFERFKAQVPLGRSAICIWLGVWSAGAQVQVRAQELSSAHPLVDSFKAFMASPPVVQDIVYCKFTPRNPLVGLPEVLTTNQTTDTLVYYHARYQPDCLFLEARTNWNFALGREAAGLGLWIRRGESFWLLEDSRMAISWKNRIPSASGINTSPAFTFHHFSEEFNEVINMGLMHLELGAVHWRGNKFTAEGYILEIKRPVFLQGELREGQDGRVGQLDVEYKVDSEVHRYAEKYEYENDIGVAHLPSAIKSFLISNGKPIKLMEWRIFSIKTRSVRLPTSAFDAPAILAASGIRTLSYNNREFYAKNALGFQAPIGNGLGPGSSPRWHREVCIFVAAAAIYTAAIFGRVWKKKTNQANERKFHET